jgi:uncharacterized protein YjgD (DUF1641 family)
MTETNDTAVQLAEINDKLDRVGRILEDLSRRMESFDDLKEDLVPIAHGALKIANNKLHELEQEGALDFAAESVLVAKKIATHFSREDVRLLGDNVVKILETVRSLTQPGVLHVADRAAIALQEGPEDGGVGIFKAMRDPEIRRGMALLFAVLRELGSASGNGEQREAKKRTD